MYMERSQFDDFLRKGAYGKMAMKAQMADTRHPQPGPSGTSHPRSGGRGMTDVQTDWEDIFFYPRHGRHWITDMHTDWLDVFSLYRQTENIQQYLYNLNTDNSKFLIIQSDFEDPCTWNISIYVYPGLFSLNNSNKIVRSLELWIIIALDNMLFSIQKYWYFFISPQKHKLWVLIRSTLARHF